MVFECLRQWIMTAFTWQMQTEDQYLHFGAQCLMAEFLNFKVTVAEPLQ